MPHFGKIRAFARTGAVLGCAGILAPPALSAERLPSLQADPSQTSVSGISSGAFLAVQLHVAHSSSVRGAGVIAGGPYFCAENSSSRATANCMKPDESHPPPDVGRLKEITQSLGRSGAIDEPARLKDSRVWLFSGQADKVVETPVMDALARYYGEFLDEANIAFKHDLNAGHAMVTDDFGGTCAYTGPPFIDDCDYDAAGALLKQIYGRLNPPAGQAAGQIVEFDQNEFLPDGDAHAHSLDDTGFAYVPADCKTEPCRVHIALHGCLQQAEAVDDAFYRHAGYNRWADTNRMIVLYPQTITRYGWGWPFYTFNFVWNPNACWDWWGYDSAGYHTKKGPQIQAIWGMLERLAGAKTASRSLP